MCSGLQCCVFGEICCIDLCLLLNWTFSVLYFFCLISPVPLVDVNMTNKWAVAVFPYHVSSFQTDGEMTICTEAQHKQGLFWIANHAKLLWYSPKLRIWSWKWAELFHFKYSKQFNVGNTLCLASACTNMAVIIFACYHTKYEHRSSQIGARCWPHSNQLKEAVLFLFICCF